MSAEMSSHSPQLRLWAHGEGEDDGIEKLWRRRDLLHGRQKEGHVLVAFLLMLMRELTEASERMEG